MEKVWFPLVCTAADRLPRSLALCSPFPSWPLMNVGSLAYLECIYESKEAVFRKRERIAMLVPDTKNTMLKMRIIALIILPS